MKPRVLVFLEVCQGFPMKLPDEPEKFKKLPVEPMKFPTYKSLVVMRRYAVFLLLKESTITEHPLQTILGRGKLLLASSEWIEHASDKRTRARTHACTRVRAHPGTTAHTRANSCATYGLTTGFSEKKQYEWLAEAALWISK